MRLTPARRAARIGTIPGAKYCTCTTSGRWERKKPTKVENKRPKLPREQIENHNLRSGLFEPSYHRCIMLIVAADCDIISIPDERLISDNAANSLPPRKETGNADGHARITHVPDAFDGAEPIGSKSGSDPIDRHISQSGRKGSRHDMQRVEMIGLVRPAGPVILLATKRVKHLQSSLNYTGACRVSSLCRILRPGQLLCHDQTMEVASAWREDDPMNGLPCATKAKFVFSSPRTQVNVPDAPANHLLVRARHTLSFRGQGPRSGPQDAGRMKETTVVAQVPQDTSDRRGPHSQCSHKKPGKSCFQADNFPQKCPVSLLPKYPTSLRSVQKGPRFAHRDFDQTAPIDIFPSRGLSADISERLHVFSCRGGRSTRQNSRALALPQNLRGDVHNPEESMPAPGGQALDKTAPRRLPRRNSERSHIPRCCGRHESIQKRIDSVLVWILW